MELTVYKVYNRVVHSYLAVFEVEQTGDEDINIFVCKDLPGNAPIPPAPPSDSSLQEESFSTTPSTAPEGTSSPGPSVDPESSAEEQTSSTEEVVSSEAPEESSVISSDGSPAPSGTSGYEEQMSSIMEETSSLLAAQRSSSAEESEMESSEELSSTTPLFTVYPARTLVSIASLTDLDVLPLVPSAPGGLYRVSTVAMIFRSLSHMNRVVEEVLQDVRTNAQIQRIPIKDYEVVELQDPVFGQDEDRIYYFR